MQDDEIHGFILNLHYEFTTDTIDLIKKNLTIYQMKSTLFKYGIVGKFGYYRYNQIMASI